MALLMKPVSWDRIYQSWSLLRSKRYQSKEAPSNPPDTVAMTQCFSGVCRRTHSVSHHFHLPHHSRCHPPISKADQPWCKIDPTIRAGFSPQVTLSPSKWLGQLSAIMKKWMNKNTSRTTIWGRAWIPMATISRESWALEIRRSCKMVTPRELAPAVKVETTRSMGGPVN